MPDDPAHEREKWPRAIMQTRLGEAPHRKHGRQCFDRHHQPAHRPPAHTAVAAASAYNIPSELVGDGVTMPA
jgi:hypothetical protein